MNVNVKKLGSRKKLDRWLLNNYKYGKDKKLNVEAVKNQFELIEELKDYICNEFEKTFFNEVYYFKNNYKETCKIFNLNPSKYYKTRNNILDQLIILLSYQQEDFINEQ